MDIRIEKAVKKLEKDIEKKEKQIEIIKKIDSNMDINEESWYEICETPLCSSNLLDDLVKNTFKDAEDIDVDFDYLYFTLHGFKCGLPISKNHGVYIDTSWYRKDFGKPVHHWTNKEFHMKKYFEEKDKNSDWEILFNERFWYRRHINKLKKFILWFGCYKWKDENRQKWEEIFARNQQCQDRMTEEYNKTRKEMYEKTKDMLYVVIPKLKSFSKEVKPLPTYICLTPKEIANLEGFVQEGVYEQGEPRLQRR